MRDGIDSRLAVSCGQGLDSPIYGGPPFDVVRSRLESIEVPFLGTLMAVDSCGELVSSDLDTSQELALAAVEVEWSPLPALVGSMTFVAHDFSLRVAQGAGGIDSRFFATLSEKSCATKVIDPTKAGRGDHSTSTAASASS